MKVNSLMKRGLDVRLKVLRKFRVTMTHARAAAARHALAHICVRVCRWSRNIRAGAAGRPLTTVPTF